MTIRDILHTKKPEKIIGEIMIKRTKTKDETWDDIYLTAKTSSCRYGQSYRKTTLKNAIDNFKDFYNFWQESIISHNILTLPIFTS